jgi:hypothetical protein
MKFKYQQKIKNKMSIGLSHTTSPIKEIAVLEERFFSGKSWYFVCETFWVAV